MRQQARKLDSGDSRAPILKRVDNNLAEGVSSQDDASSGLKKVSGPGCDREKEKLLNENKAPVFNKGTDLSKEKSEEKKKANERRKEGPYQSFRHSLNDIKSATKSLFGVMKRTCAGNALLRAALTLPQAAQAVLIPLVTGSLVNAVNSGQIGSIGPKLGVVLGGTFFMMGLVGVWQGYLSHKMRAIIQGDGQMNPVNKINSLSFAEHFDPEVSKSIHKTRRNIHRLSNFGDGVYQILGQGLSFGGAAFAMGLVNWKLASLISLSALPLICLELKKVDKADRAENIKAKIEKNYWPQYFIFTNKDGRVEFKILDKTQWVKTKLRKSVDRLKRIETRLARVFAKINLGHSLVNSTLLGGSLGWIIFQAAKGAYDGGQVAQFVGASAALQWATSGLSKSIGNAALNARFVNELFGLKKESKNRKEEKAEVPNRSEQFRELLKSHLPGIRIESLKYEIEDQCILDIPELDIHPGELVGVVGKKGSGKSTFVSLLMGIREPTEGRVLIKLGDQEFNLKEISLADWHHYIGFISQGAYDGFGINMLESVKLGIRPEEEGYSVSEVLGETGAREILKRKSNGNGDSELSEKKEADGGQDKQEEQEASYDSPADVVIGGEYNNARELSGGERQQVNYARGRIAKNRTVAIHDEPASNLDAESEACLVGLMKKDQGRKTQIVISHRYGTLMDADRVIVFKDGKIESVGTQEELLKNKDGVFAKQYLQQLISLLPGMEVKIVEGKVEITPKRES